MAARLGSAVAPVGLAIAAGVLVAGLRGGSSDDRWLAGTARPVIGIHQAEAHLLAVLDLPAVLQLATRVVTLSISAPWRSCSTSMS